MGGGGGRRTMVDKGERQGDLLPQKPIRYQLSVVALR